MYQQKAFKFFIHSSNYGAKPIIRQQLSTLITAEGSQSLASSGTGFESSLCTGTKQDFSGPQRIALCPKLFYRWAQKDCF